MACGQRDALVDGEENVETTKFFSVVYRIYILKMEDGLAPMILAEPTIFYGDGPRIRRPFWIRKKHVLEFRETLGKVGEDFGGKFAFVAARFQEMRDGEIAGSFGHG